MAFSVPDSFWINPCGYSSPDEGGEVPDEEVVMTLLDEIIRSADASHNQAINLTETILSNTELTEDSLMMQKYDWLQPPPSEDSYFESLTRDDALKEAYYLLQKFAVALQQMIMDQERIDNYHSELLEAKEMIRELLCSLHTPILVLNIEQLSDATEDVMEEELRTLTDSKILVRDYIIARDYARAASYMRELATFLKNQ